MDQSNSSVQPNQDHPIGTTQRQYSGESSALTGGRYVVKNKIKLEPVEELKNQQRPFDDTILLNHKLICNYPDHHEMQEKVDQLVYEKYEADVRLEEMEKFTNEVISQSQGQLQEFQQRIQALEKNGAVKDLKIADLTALLSSQTRKIQKHDKDAETVKITLDEKEKQVAELERSLNDEKKKVVTLEKSLLNAGRALRGLGTDRQEKEKELKHLKVEARQKDVALTEAETQIATLKRQKMDLRTVNLQSTTLNGVAQVQTTTIRSAGSPHDSFVKVGKKIVHFKEARVAKLYFQSVCIQAFNASKKIIALDIFIEDSKDFGMLDESGNSSVSRRVLKVESGEKVYLQVSFSPRSPGIFNTQLVITPSGGPASNLRCPRYLVSLSGEAFR